MDGGVGLHERVLDKCVDRWRARVDCPAVRVEEGIGLNEGIRPDARVRLSEGVGIAESVGAHVMRAGIGLPRIDRRAIAPEEL
ncbi:MAG: hypothetical protein IT379_30005 [Deltaproteobacteria bacterium]|nr:hypothetical protein [Deltaproteobacteria bacterium]